MKGKNYSFISAIATLKTFIMVILQYLIAENKNKSIPKKRKFPGIYCII